MKTKAAVLIVILTLFAAASAWTADPATLKAGTAKAVITPAQYQGRVLVMGYQCKGFIRDLHARALSLNDGHGRLVIVTYDLNCLDVATPILRSRCLHELGLDPARLILMGTHNHAAPIQIVPDNYDYGRWLADRIFDLIREAMDDEQGPARLYFGSGEGRWLMATGGHKVDPEVQVLKVTVDDRVKAVLFNQPTHPMQSSFWRIETGHPGYAMDYVEKKFPGALALYADACGGNQFPLVGTVMLTARPVEKLLGAMVGAKVVSIAHSNLTEVTGPLSSNLQVISLPLAPPLSLEDARALAQKEKVDLSLGFVPYPHPQRGYNWIRNLIRHYEQHIPFPTRTDERVCTDDGFLVRELPEPREFPCRYEEAIVARVGPMVLVSMQGEVCAPIGRRIKDAFKGQGPLMVFAYMGEHNLYIPTRKLIEQKAYQALVIQTQYASPVGWSPDVEDVMVDSMVKMIREAWKNQ